MRFENWRNSILVKASEKEVKKICELALERGVSFYPQLEDDVKKNRAILGTDGSNTHLTWDGDQLIRSSLNTDERRDKKSVKDFLNELKPEVKPKLQSVRKMNENDFLDYALERLDAKAMFVMRDNESSIYQPDNSDEAELYKMPELLRITLDGLYKKGWEK